MFSRNHFKAALYKLILLKSIVDTKVHKENLHVIAAYEKMTKFIEDLR